MKKLLSIGLAAMLAFGLATTSFAQDKAYTKDDDMTTVSISKTYTLENAGTVSPAETFYLEQIGKAETQSGATDIPDLVKLKDAQGNDTEYVAEATFDEGAAGDATKGTQNFVLTLPNYSTVGVYEYTLQEVAGDTAGVTYRGESMKVVVTVINTDDGKIRIAGVHTEKQAQEGEEKPAKSDSFDDNKYSAGNLNVSKTVTGNLGDENKYFEFKVTLTGVGGKKYRDSYTVTGGSNDKNPSTIKIGEETTFLLKHGETIHIENLPYGVTYTVTETAAEGYTTEKTGDTGKINAADQAAEFTNTKDGSIDTGVVLNNMPYILVLAVLAAGVAVFIIRKRRED